MSDWGREEAIAECRDLRSRRDELEAERDDLRAENARLQKARDDMWAAAETGVHEGVRLRAENARLREALEEAADAIGQCEWSDAHAKPRSDAQVQSGEASQRLEEGSESEVPQAGDSDHDERET